MSKELFSFNNNLDLFSDVETIDDNSSSSPQEPVNKQESSNKSSKEENKNKDDLDFLEDGKFYFNVDPEEESEDSEELEESKVNKDSGNTNESESDSSSSGIYFLLAKNFFDHLGWDWDDSYLESDSPEGFFKLLTDIVVENSKPQYANKIVEDFDNYVKNGGNPKDFLKVVENNTLPDLDLSNEQHQAYIVYQNLKLTTKWSDDKIKRYITTLAKENELENEAKESYETVKKIYEEEKQKLFELQKLEAEKEALERYQYMENAKNFILNSTADTLGVDMTKAEKQNFLRFLFEKDNDGLTRYEKKLMSYENADLKIAAFIFKGLLDGKLDKIAKKQVIDELEEKLKKNAETMFTKKGNKGITKRGGLNLDILD
jgi:hypothetical protein